MATGFPHPFRRRGETPAETARDRAFEMGEQARRAQQEEDKKVRIALNALRQKDRRERAEEEELRAELEKVEIPPRVLSDEEAWAEGGEWLSVTSSNVAAIAYDAEDERLLIQYRDGSVYAYSPVNMPMAIELYRAPSKGDFVWDRLRIRGTSFGYQVPYELLSGPSQRRLGHEARAWMRSEETRRKHGHIPPSGRDYYGKPIRPRDVR